jgi:hypothetical protein
MSRTVRPVKMGCTDKFEAGTGVGQDSIRRFAWSWSTYSDSS